MLKLEVVSDQVEEIKNEYKNDPLGLSRIMDKLIKKYGLMDSILPCSQSLYGQMWLVPEEKHAAFMEFFNSKGYLKSSNS